MSLAKWRRMSVASGEVDRLFLWMSVARWGSGQISRDGRVWQKRDTVYVRDSDGAHPKHPVSPFRDP